MKIRRIDKSQSALKTKEIRVLDDVGLSREVYAKMSSLTDNKVIVEPEGKDSPFERFLVDMESIHDGTNTDEDIALLDQYLGNLGDGEWYPFPQDTYVVEPWIDESEQFPTRNVIDRDGNNVIDRATGFNVVHNTVFEG